MIPDIETIIENMSAVNCSREDIERVRAMHEAGMASEIIRCLRMCRCSLMDELHETQRKVDRMDHLIRSTQADRPLE